MSNTELIAEARKHASDAPLGIGAYQVSLLNRLADALEAAGRWREAAEAVLGEVKVQGEPALAFLERVVNLERSA